MRLAAFQQISKLLLTLAPLLWIISPAGAQDTQAKYARKSISYVDAVLPVGENVQLSAEQEAYLLQAVKQEIEMSRFDYNPLPQEILVQFQQVLKERGARDLETVAAAMNEVLTPRILSIVDYEKEMRAQGLISEEQRHSFISDKAKESGLTAENLQAIMNSAYIYLPIITEVKMYDYASTNTINFDLRGGIIWFAVKTGETGAAVQLLVKQEAVGKGAAKRTAKISYHGQTLSGPQYAFVTAAEVLARNLRVATQQIPEFQLTNPLTATGRGWVEFGAGKKEGLGIDDKFLIVEYYEQADGTLKPKKLGMVRVSKVADNTSQAASSRARTVLGPGYEKGMQAVEHPRMPIDLSFRFAMIPVHVSNPTYTYGGLQYTWFDDEISSNFAAGQLWFNYNLAKGMKMSQFYASIYGEIGGGTLDGWKMYGQDAPGGLYWGVGGGLVKKFYVNRLHLGLEALVSFADYRFSGTGSDSYGDHDWEWSLSNLGLSFNGNLEFALSYDWNLGAGVAYRLFSPSSDWTYTLDGVDYDKDALMVSFGGDLPELDYSGLGFQVYLTWNLPSLSYDPMKMLRGTMDF